MNSQHLSDEAVAAFADGVLRGHACDRASRHTAECAECADAVRVQREAVLALRAAPPPALPTDLFDRLRGLPAVTPVTTLPTVIGPDGSRMLSTMAPMAAFLPGGGPQSPAATDTDRGERSRRSRRGRAAVLTVAAVALAGALTAGSASSSAATRTGEHPDPAPPPTTHPAAPAPHGTPGAPGLPVAR